MSVTAAAAPVMKTSGRILSTVVVKRIVLSRHTWSVIRVALTLLLGGACWTVGKELALRSLRANGVDTTRRVVLVAPNGDEYDFNPHGSGDGGTASYADNDDRDDRDNNDGGFGAPR